ncbi:amino acid ABC transporter ATP-binding protein [Paraburkholderia sediminicola]|uniref:amino acid ABC transporter ATP-binding protein n=1 Tax=Paraburkholderia sediminicola TaxID=458836 RepID=UPI0038BC0BE1
MSAGGIALRLSALQKRYGNTTVLDDFYLDVREGEIVALLGPSGCGKSTLLRCVTWLEPPDDGFIEVGGKPFGRTRVGAGVIENQSRTAIDRMRPSIGLVFQQLNLWPHMTALENVVRAQCVVLGRPRAEAERRGESLLSRLGLGAFAKRPVHSLSGGQRQRVAIARALAMDPAVMLFDEPTSALDPELVGEVLELLKTLASQGTTMLVVTHSVGFAAALANRIAFMEGGRIVEEGAPQSLLASPRTERLRAFLQHAAPERLGTVAPVAAG